MALVDEISSSIVSPASMQSRGKSTRRVSGNRNGHKSMESDVNNGVIPDSVTSSSRKKTKRKGRQDGLSADIDVMSNGKLPIAFEKQLHRNRVSDGMLQLDSGNETLPKKRSRNTGVLSINDSLLKKTKQDTGVQTYLHRCRFVDWTPSPVYCLASNSNGRMVALSRRGGSVEVWRIAADNSDGVNGCKWNQSLFIPGQQGDSDLDNSILSLCWMDFDHSSDSGATEQISSLFGGDIDGSVFEVDLYSEKRIDCAGAFGGPAWCIDGHAKTHRIAVGCDDGRVRLYSILPEGGLCYERTLHSSVDGRLLALRWHQQSSDDSLVLYTGGMDGVIRKWDVSSGRVVMEIATESYGKSEPVLVRCLCVLSDYTLFSGDSEGHVHVWDTRDESGGSLLTAFHEHNADVLSIVSSTDEKCVFASGIDSRVSLFQSDSNSTSARSWVYTYSHRPHSHDVRGLALVNDGRHIVSAGDDSQFCVYPVANFSRERPSKVFPFLHRRLVHFSQNSEFMLVQHAFHIEIWKPQMQELILVMRFKDRHGIRCSAFSKNGRYIAVADEEGLKVFELILKPQSSNTNADDSFSLVRISFDKSVVASIAGSVVVSLSFASSNDMLACALQDGSIEMLRVENYEGIAKPIMRRHGCLKQLSLHRRRLLSAQERLRKAVLCEATDYDDEIDYDSDEDMSRLRNDVGYVDDLSILGGAVQSIEWSLNGEWLAVGESLGSIMVFSVDTQTLQSEISPAQLGGMYCTSFTFQPIKNNGMLAISTMPNRVFLYDVDNNRLDPWNKGSGLRLKVHQSSECVLGISFCTDDPQNAIIWGRTFFTKVDFSQQNKQKKLVTDFKPLVYLEKCEQNKVILLEAPWIKIMKTFPPVLFRKKYGGAT